MKIPELPNNRLKEYYNDSVLRDLFMRDCPKIPQDNGLLSLFNSRKRQERIINKPN